MSKKFLRKFIQSQTFDEWMKELQRFSFSLIKENNLQRWTKADFQNYWTQHKGASV